MPISHRGAVPCLVAKAARLETAASAGYCQSIFHQGAAAIPAHHVTLVLGGARSGKSRYAESLLGQYPAPWNYIATAEAFDDEMRARIAQHQARRGQEWRTVEAPLDLTGALLRESAAPALVDCLTLWLTNLMLGGYIVDDAVAALEAALPRRQASTILVSNELGLGIVPETPLGREFRDEAGRLNQRIAAVADRVFFMVAGLPLMLK